MIYGIGNDLIEISRVKKIISKNHGDRFVNRILTTQEKNIYLERGKNRVEFLAGRFAAKEAIVKALGCGIGKHIGFQDINIVPNSLGKPVCNISSDIVNKLGIKSEVKLHISITHSDTMAAAFAVIEI
ncbi:holo-ACP synthase [Chengkuizengella axinellae]|uniref:Holo-[acyl-carrier-protein] synthase n=1 Tax=Chengkuizengella axinellae TaxID=3064388 RepID=A0ABT9J0B2_9BACL|nr:holo-ACP synthase [Chengkuizengella sp. 2205SS18-9]MDP5275048.1 holo-ACP synthase [Chengkuizengella sp. 2205SS18-9]